jgi:hypothetical protein
MYMESNYYQTPGERNALGRKAVSEGSATGPFL